MPFAEVPCPATPPHLRPEVLVPYNSPPGPRSETDRYPDDLYEYIWNAPERIPGATRATHAGDGGFFALITLPHPVRGLNIATGTSILVLSAILHEETLSQEGGPAIVTVGGCLFDNIEEATNNWEDFIIQDLDISDIPENESDDPSPDDLE